MIYWFTGQPGAGKTSLAMEFIKTFPENEKPHHIDGDKLRKIFHNYSYDKEGRIQNIQNVITIARYLDFFNHHVVISVVAPIRELRESLKSTNTVTEVYLHTSDKRGREHFFTDYEKPLKNFIEIDTTGKTVEQSLHEFTSQLKY